MEVFVEHISYFLNWILKGYSNDGLHKWTEADSGVSRATVNKELLKHVGNCSEIGKAEFIKALF